MAWTGILLISAIEGATLVHTDHAKLVFSVPFEHLRTDSVPMTEVDAVVSVYFFLRRLYMMYVIMCMS